MFIMCYIILLTNMFGFISTERIEQREIMCEMYNHIHTPPASLAP